MVSKWLSQWRSNDDLIQRIRPQGQGRGFRMDEQVRLGSEFCIVACFRIQIPSAEQFKTRLGTKRQPLANTKRFRAASGPDKNLKGEMERNTQIKSREKLDHQIKEESQKKKKQKINISTLSLYGIFLFKRVEATIREFKDNIN